MMARSYAATELRNISSMINGGGAQNANPPQRARDQPSNEYDVGYDTDSIAIFEIDKAFTDYLLCQICFKMSRDAKECDYCNKLYCKLCIENWLIMNKDCPMCHLDIKIRGASRVVKEIIYSFRI